MPKTSFINGDASQGTRGTRVTAEYLNAVNNHHHTGLDQDGHGALAFAADTGTANAYVVALSPALSQYITGMPIYFKAANANTGTSTININGLGVKSIKKNLIENLVIGDIMADQIYCVVFDGMNFQLITLPAQEKITASDILSDFVVSGLVGTDPGASLSMTIPGGIAYVMGRRVVKLSGASDLTRTYTASKDTYVDISHTGVTTYSEVNNGAGAPSVAANSLRLMKVVTNTAEITGVTDLRTTPGMKTSATPAANTIPISNANGKLDGWVTNNYVKVTDTKSSGTAGMTISSGVWNKRDLNTEDSDASGLASLSTNQLTLLAGTYECNIVCCSYGGAPAGHSMVCKARLQNVSDSSTTIMGTSIGRSSNIGGLDDTFWSFINGKFTIATQKTFEIQEYWVINGMTIIGGIPASQGSEVYLIAEFWKVA